jgi:hypothetical protein
MSSTATLLSAGTLCRRSRKADCAARRATARKNRQKRWQKCGQLQWAEACGRLLGDMAQYTFGVPHCVNHAIRSVQTDTLVASTALRVMNAQGALITIFRRNQRPPVTSRRERLSIRICFIGM